MYTETIIINLHNSTRNCAWGFGEKDGFYPWTYDQGERIHWTNTLRRTTNSFNCPLTETALLCQATSSHVRDTLLLVDPENCRIWREGFLLLISSHLQGKQMSSIIVPATRTLNHSVGSFKWSSEDTQSMNRRWCVLSSQNPWGTYSIKAWNRLNTWNLCKGPWFPRLIRV